MSDIPYEIILLLPEVYPLEKSFPDEVSWMGYRCAWNIDILNA